jgi:hypothetical protein
MMAMAFPYGENQRKSCGAFVINDHNKAANHDWPRCFPSLSLAEARSLRAQYLSLLARGIDPQTQAEQAAEQQQIAIDSIFSNVAANWFHEAQQRYTRLCEGYLALVRKIFSRPLVRSRSGNKSANIS